MNGTVDDSYLEWLYDQVSPASKSRSYWKLARQLYKKQFSWFIPNDDNRVEDGKDLRYAFFDEIGVDGDSNWLQLGCSMLEMFVGLAYRVSFESYGTPADWFWEFMNNLGLDEYTDDVYDDKVKRRVSTIINRVIDRTYSATGEGGIFPLKHSTQDQRKIEIWYQMSNYLIEDEFDQ